MCVNYTPAGRDAIRDMFGIEVPELNLRPEIWQDYIAPIVLRPDDGPAYCAPASYGFVPQKHRPPGVTKLTTMNARAETIGSLRSYKQGWSSCHLCLVPMLAFFEPNYESGSPVRWRIGMANGDPFAVAGMWRTWERDDGKVDCSFTQITINADEHDLMKRFHRPGDEKRSLVIVPSANYQAWLACRDPELARTYLRPYPAHLMAAEPARLQPRKKATSA